MMFKRFFEEGKKMYKISPQIFLIGVLIFFGLRSESSYAMKKGANEDIDTLDKEPSASPKRKTSIENDSSNISNLSQLGTPRYDKKRDMYFYGENLSTVKTSQKARPFIRQGKNTILVFLDESENNFEKKHHTLGRQGKTIDTPIKKKAPEANTRKKHRETLKKVRNIAKYKK